MPHTNRKKKTTAGSTTTPANKPTIIHTKRKEVEDDSGWTHIVDTPRTRSATLKSKTNPVLHAGDFEVNGVSYVNRTLEELRTDHEFWKKGWEESEACKELKAILEIGGGKEGTSRRKVDNVVVLGLGSLQSSRREGRKTSSTQLAALQTITLTLSPNLPVVAQDPQFTDLDKEFLSTFGYKTVDDPDAFKEIKEGTLVYAIHCYAKVYKAVTEQTRPAILIGTNVGNFGKFDTSETIEDVAKCLEELVEGCEVLDFPQLRHDFSDTKIYWRWNGQVVDLKSVDVIDEVVIEPAAESKLGYSSEPLAESTTEPFSNTVTAHTEEPTKEQAPGAMAEIIPKPTES